MTTAQDEAAEWRALIETMPQIVWITRPDGWHAHFNRRWMDFTGLTLEESLGDGWNPPFHPEDRLGAAARWDEATRTGQPYEIEYRLRRHDGVYHWMLGRAMPLRNASGDIVKWFGTCTDIEQLKRAEAHIEAQAELLTVKHERLRAVAELSHHLNGAMTPDEVIELMVRHGCAAIDASSVDVVLVDGQQPVHELGESAADGLHDHDLDRDLDRDLDGVGNSISMPLADADGTVIGVLDCGWPNAVAFDSDLRVQLRLLVDLGSQALQRTRRTEAQDGLVHELQDEVLAGHDEVQGLDVAIGYEPAQDHLGFGGDWYDVIAIDEHRTTVVVGDVAGHGIAAAAEMTAAKAVIRGMVLTAGVPGEVIPAANRALDHHRSGYIATVAAAWIDTHAGELAWQIAGHPSPVLRTAGGSTCLLSGPQHPPLGMPSSGREVAPASFPPGSVLVLYTDGLIERRDAHIDERLEVLRSLVESLPDDWSAAEIRDRLMEGLIGPDTVDDVAVVVVRN